MSPVCKFCGYRCGESNPVPFSGVPPFLATCEAGRIADRDSIGYDIRDAELAYPRKFRVAS